MRVRGGVAIAAAALVLALAFGGDARAWGPEAHSYVAALAVEGLPSGPLKEFYEGNEIWLETNASLADRWRLRGDRMEPPRHRFYIDRFLPPAAAADTAVASATASPDAAPIANIAPDGGTTAPPPPAVSPDPRVALRGRTEDEVAEDGVLPWTIERHSRLLSSALREHRYDDAMVETAFLAGYAADACEPLRASPLGGDADSPKTVAHRFEAGLVRRGVSFRDLSAVSTLKPIADPAHAAIDALQAAADAAPRIVAADSLAGGDDAANGPQPDVYWDLFSRGIRPTALAQIDAGGQFLAELLQAAWIDAGKPALPRDFLMTDALLPFAPPSMPSTAINETDFPPVSDTDLDAARARVLTIAVTSRLLKRDVTVNVVLPRDYARGSRSFPVLYLLHGSSGHADDWPRRAGIAAYAENLPLIVVMPDAGNSWYVDSPDQGPYESFFITELVPAIDQSFRTISTREGRALAGNSMGGYGAWHLALDHNDLFCCAASLSGALDMGVGDPPDGEPHDWITDLYGVDDRRTLRAYHADDLYHRIDSLTRRGRWTGPALRFDAGWDDYLLDGDRHMHRYLLDRNLPFEYSEFPGSHNWTYWDEHIRDALNFVLRHVSPPVVR